MMNQKGGVVLRDIVFMMMIVSAIFVFAGLFVGEMAFNYDNTNMSSEWVGGATNRTSFSVFYDFGENITETGEGLSSESTGFFSFIEGAGNVLKGAGKTLLMILTAPNTIGDLVEATLIDANAPSYIASAIKYLIIIIFWGVIIFTIVAAFLRGGKL